MWVNGWVGLYWTNYWPYWTNYWPYRTPIRQYICPPYSMTYPYTIPVKSLDTPTHSRVFLYLYYFLHCRIIVKTSKLWNNIWNHVVTKKVLNKSKHILDSRFFKVATLCLDDSLAHSWHSLNQLHLECFSNIQFPHMLSTCWLHFLHSAVLRIPNHLNWVEVRWLWRPGHLIQHSITVLLGQIAITQPGGVFWVIVLLNIKW